VLYLRLPDGRREARPLENSIDLPGESKLWFYPTPGPPSVATPAWTAEARSAWLNGTPAPDPADLFRRLCERIAQFIDFPRDVAASTRAVLALWTILTYVYQAWDAVPYLFVGGPVGSGKSTLFAILARLIFRPSSRRT
jgi:hypothetical protein